MIKLIATKTWFIRSENVLKDETSKQWREVKRMIRSTHFISTGVIVTYASWNIQEFNRTGDGYVNKMSTTSSLLQNVNFDAEISAAGRPRSATGRWNFCIEVGEVEECWIQNFSKFVVTEIIFLELRFPHHYPRLIYVGRIFYNYK